MKWIRIIFFIGSIVVLFLIVYAIVNTMVSYKYEIEEPSKLNQIDIELAKGYLNSRITWLWYFFSYVGINVLFLLVSIFYKKK
jgi:hypothetical protein